MKTIATMLCLCAGAAAAAAHPPAPGMEIPPGWSAAAATSAMPQALIVLRGPESASFIVAPAGAVPPGASGVKRYLAKVLEGIKSGSGGDYRTDGEIETRLFRNGVSAQMLRATLDGRPRLVVALLDAGGAPLLATLSSAAPEAMLTPLIGGLRPSAPEGEVRMSGVERSLDGQLEIALGGGRRGRALTVDERGRGAVMAVQEAGAEIVFFKLSPQDAAAKDQPGLVRATVADELKVSLDSVPPARRAPTPAGPAAACTGAAVPGSPDLRFAAAYLPWGYWGYSALARGPKAEDALIGVLAALKPGPDALPKLLADTPVLELPDPDASRRAALAAAAAAAAVVMIVWSLTRKKGSLPS